MWLLKIWGLLIFVVNIGFSQSYEVKLTPIHIEGLGGIQSYAVGTYHGEWLLVGGRLDGLHRREPFVSFSEDGKNQELIVVNPNEGKVWRKSLASLPTSLIEQLSSTNMQFYQDEDRLLCIGGYGYSPTKEDHITFPYLTVIDLPKAIKAVKSDQLEGSAFQQISNELFRVTGGGLNKIDDVFLLVGGHKFMGRYNPMGAEFGPGFIQEYTDEIRRFKITNNENLSIEILDAAHDEFHLHRRDYNLVPYMSGDKRKLMAYSGVFKNTADLPWLYPVSISKDSHEPIEDFIQYFNHYHCANIPIYHSDRELMHTLFFGGIAQFYEEEGILVQDNDIPFVSTITDVQLNKYGELMETKLETAMPGYLGAGSVFLKHSNTKTTGEGIIDGTQMGDDFTSVGHIYGGIRSSMPNIFWLNTGVESEASHTIYEVSLREVPELPIQVREYLQFYPDPENQLVRMSIDLKKAEDMTVIISDDTGEQIHRQVIPGENLKVGRNYLTLDQVNIKYGSFHYKVMIGDKTIDRKVLWAE